MNETTKAEAIVRLADIAIDAAGGIGADAAVMLVDAAIAIALTRFGGRADEIAGHLAAYVVQQVSHVTGKAGNG